jgi:hypothetical protein
MSSLAKADLSKAMEFVAYYDRCLAFTFPEVLR